MARKFAAMAAVLALAGVLAAGCSKKQLTTQPSFTVPEGTPSSDLQLITFMDGAGEKIRLTDNVVQFTTARYRENPLIVQGPGAGPEVTAAGVFADLLRIAASLGARI